MLTDAEGLLTRFQPLLRADSRDRFLDGVTMHGAMTHGWAQYWIAWPGDRDHTGIDWEMVMLHMGRRYPDRVVMAQHRTARAYDWMQCTRDGDEIYVYASLDKHAGYPEGGWHRHGWRWDRCNGETRLKPSLNLSLPVAVTYRRAYRDPEGWLNAVG